MADTGADLNLPTADEYGSIPAMLCSKNGHVNCLALLSSKGADMSKANNDGSTSAHAASQIGQLKCLQLLAKRGVDLSKKDASGHTPLDVGRLFKQPECIDLLLACGAIGAHAVDLCKVPVDLQVRVAVYINCCLV
jgi:ankyrin repeat protein